MNLLNFIADIALRSSLVLAFVLFLQWALRRASAAERHCILLLGLAVVAIIPAARLLGPHIPWTIKLPAAETRVLDLPEELIDSADVSPASFPATSLTPARPPQIPHRRAVITLAHLLWTLLALGASVQILLLAKASRSWRKIRRAAQQASLNPAALARVLAAARPLPPVLVSDEIDVPVLAGWLRPVIILPRSTLESSDASLSMILCHEVAHFRRGDSFLLPLQWLLQVVYWWHPLVWLALASLRREREIACDDLVLSHNFRATDYAGLIVDTARDMQIGPCILPAVLAMASRSAVCRRVTSILDRRVRRKPAALWITIPGTLAALTLCLPMIAAEIKPADPSLAALHIAPWSPASPQLKITFRLVLIDLPTYLQNQPAMDAVLKTGDPSRISKLPGAYLQSVPAYIAESGKQFRWADVNPMTFPAAFDTDDDGNITPANYRSQKLGPTFTDVATLQPDNETVRMQFKCSLTYFKQWQQLPSRVRKPVFGKKVIWTTRNVRNGHALWAVPGANRYLPPDKLAADPFGGDWPSGKDTSPKRMFILVTARPAPSGGPAELVADAASSQLGH